MKKVIFILVIIHIVFIFSCKKTPTSSKNMDEPANTGPTASFTVNVTSGTVNTIFNFDATGCFDNEDGKAILQVRWDWNNDGVYDTDFSTTKTATHQYSEIGTHTIKLEVKDSGELTNTTTKTVSITNSAPTASFTADPPAGNTATTFTFDANDCTDDEDDTSLLEVRWDFENDGTWDTNFSTSKTITHQYPVFKCEDNVVKLEVKDSQGLTNTKTKIILVSWGYTQTVTDIDGNIYNAIQIGNQLWMAENLKVTHYRNGDAIPNNTDIAQWEFLTTGAYCNYDNTEANGERYGRLYNWYAVDDARGLAPEGWHVSSDEEWKELEMYLGMSQADADNDGYERGTDEGAKLKSCTGWVDTQISFGGGNGTNEIGFNAHPAGYQTMTGSWNMFRWGNFWTTTAWSDTWCWKRELIYSYPTIMRLSGVRYSGNSVRCIKD